MRRGHSIVWIVLFAVLLVINAVVGISVWSAGNLNFDAPSGDDSLMEAPDEINLGWWPEEISTGVTVENEFPVALVEYPHRQTTDISGDGAHRKDYVSLIAKYTRALKDYLVQYFRVTQLSMEKDKQE